MGKLRGWMKGIGWWALVFLAACKTQPWTPAPITVVPISTQTATAAPTATFSPAPSPTATYMPTAFPTATKTPTPASSGTATASPADFSLQKSAQCNPSGSCTFTIVVTNHGPTAYTGGIPILDQITPTMPFTLTGFGGAGGVLCYTSGSQISCGPHYPVTLPAGGTYTMTIVVQVGASGSFQNCATLQIADINPSNNTSCVTVTLQPPTPTPASGAFDLAVSKSASCSGIHTCGFTLTVTNLGPGGYTGPITIVDQTTPPWSTLFAGGGSLQSGPPCSYSGNAVVCQQSPVTLNPGQSITMFFGVYFGPTGYSQPFQNCAALQGITDTNSGNNSTCITVSPPGSTPTSTPTASPALACVISPTGLTAWWRMDDPAGSATLSEGMGAHPGTPRDSSGNLLSIGSGTGAPPWVGSVSGQVGNALFFNGSCGRIPHSPALNIGPNGMSVAGWLYAPPPSTASPALQPILDKTYSVSPGCQILQGYALFLEWNAGANAYDLIFRLGNGVGSPGSSRVTATGAVPPNQPVFVAATVAWQPGNSAEVRLYVNGSLVQMGTISGVNATNVASPADLWLAGYHGPLPSSTCAGPPGEPVGPFFGNRLRLDEWELWSRVLSPAEVAALYNHEAAGQPKCTP